MYLTCKAIKHKKICQCKDKIVIQVRKNLKAAILQKKKNTERRAVKKVGN